LYNTRSNCFPEARFPSAVVHQCHKITKAAPCPLNFILQGYKMEEEQVKPQNDTAFTDDDDDPPTLSSHALAALKEFLQQQQPITDQTSQTDGEGSETGEKVALVAEDWRLSQFWYDPLTAETVANEVLALLTNPSSLAVCIACPTLYAYIKVLHKIETFELGFASFFDGLLLIFLVFG